MALGIIVVAIAAGLVLALAVRWRSRRSPETSTVVRDLDPTDVAEIEATWSAMEAAHVRHRDELLVSRLRPLVDRKVPVRVIEPVPGRQLLRIRFADGTTVMGRGEAAGDGGVLASLIRDRSVWPGSWSTDAAGTHLVFDWSGGHCHMSVLVTGLDQPD